MSTNLPAIVYTTFIDAYQKAVAEAQEKIKKIEAGQMVYNVATEAVREMKLPNEGKVGLTEYGAVINITANKYDRFETFSKLANLIHQKTLEKKIRTIDKCPDYSFGIYGPSINWSFRTSSLKSISLNVDVPKEGILDIQVEMKTVTQTYQDIQYVMKLMPNKSIMTQYANKEGVLEWPKPTDIQF